MVNDVFSPMREVTKEKLNKAKTAIFNKSTVMYNGKKYKIQALRLTYSQQLKCLMYQAELRDETPLHWDNVVIVSLNDVEISE